MKFSESFKFYGGNNSPLFWERAEPITPDELQEQIAFCFTMKGFFGLYFKLKNPHCGMDCFQFEFETDRGLYVKDGDMKFNNFMGEDIKDSGADSVSFIVDYLIDHKLTKLILHHPDSKL